MSIFKKKPGGTVVGNFLRSTVNQLSHGVLGNGANLIPAGSTTVPDANVQAAQAKSESAIKSLLSDTVTSVPVVHKAIVQGMWDKYKAYIIGFAALLIAVLFYAFNRKPAYKRRY